MYKELFESAPGLFLALRPDFIIIDASDAYLSATMTRRDDITGRHLFEVFPDNPGDTEADGVMNLRTSLNTVLKTRAPHVMPVQKYDIRRPDGSFELRYWSPLNKPVLNKDGEVIFIIHRVSDVTEMVNPQQNSGMTKEALQNMLRQNREAEVELFNRSLQAEKRNKDLEEKLIQGTQELDATEERFRYTLDNMLEGIQIIGQDWRYLYVNEALTRHGRVARETLLGKTMMEVYPGIEHTPLFRVLKKAMTERTAMQMENDFIYADHSKSSFDLRIQPVPEGILILSIDINDRKRAEEELHRLNESLEQKILERTATLERAYKEISDYKFALDASSIISITDAEGIIKYVNRNFCTISGYSEAELTGRKHSVIDSGSHDPAFFEDMWQTISAGHIWQGEIKNRNKDNGTWWVYTTIVPFLDDKGVPYQYICMQNDISQRKRAEETEKERTLQLESVNKELDSFTYSVSHDLRTPLRSINGYARILEEEYASVLDEEGARFLKIVQASAQRMGQLIDDLLAFSKLGRKDISKSKVDMQALTMYVWNEVYKSTGTQAMAHIGPLLPAMADEGLIFQVLLNLVSNAVKYSSGRAEPEITISSEIQNGEIIYAVKDNGVGFNMDYADKLFRVFQRLHSQEEFEGTGVGLAIAARIIAKHGGRIWAHAVPDEGAVFYFSLPVGQ